MFSLWVFGINRRIRHWLNSTMVVRFWDFALFLEWLLLSTEETLERGPTLETVHWSQYGFDRFVHYCQGKGLLGIPALFGLLESAVPAQRKPDRCLACCEASIFTHASVGGTEAGLKPTVCEIQIEVSLPQTKQSHSYMQVCYDATRAQAYKLGIPKRVCALSHEHVGYPLFNLARSENSKLQIP